MTEQTDSSKNLPYTAAIRILGLIGSICAAIAVASGLAMLLLTWATSSAPAILTQLSMILLPLALILLLVVMVLSVLRRKAQ